ncbi:MAG: DUF2442 domain-containing protein [Treponema sp.]|nr:DUF2442 domain-containing protein [Treponema sp.]
MFHTVKSVDPLPDFNLHIIFNNGDAKIYDVKPMINKHEAFQAFYLTYKLFEQVKIDGGGYGVSWNEDIDLSCNELFYNGKPVFKEYENTAEKSKH